MKLGYTILYVPKVLDAVTFYEKAFGLEVAFFSESQEYAGMSTGETTLGFVCEKYARRNGLTFRSGGIKQETAAFEIAFTTKNVPKAFQKALQGGATSVLEPLEKPWGQSVAYVLDLNGVLVELCTPMI
jgi:lactoylglutathione lyase